jgi:hypothetical protein
MGYWFKKTRRKNSKNLEITVFDYERYPLLGGKAQMFSRISMSKLVLLVTGVLKLVFKGSVKWKKMGGVSGINRWAFNSSTFPPILKQFLKDPGPLKSIKRIWAAKQLLMCSDRIMWPPASKIRYRSVFSRNRLDSGRCSPGILLWKNFY